MIARATPLGGCFVTITCGKQAEHQCEACCHVELERMSGLKSKGCHAKERAEPEQPVQAPEEPVGAVSSCDTLIRSRRDLPHGSVSGFGLSRLRVPVPCCLTSVTRSHRTYSRAVCGHNSTNGWRTGAAARCDEMSQWAVLATGPPGTVKTAGVRLRQTSPGNLPGV